MKQLIKKKNEPNDGADSVIDSLNLTKAFNIATILEEFDALPNHGYGTKAKLVSKMEKTSNQVKNISEDNALLGHVMATVAALQTHPSPRLEERLNVLQKQIKERISMFLNH